MFTCQCSVSSCKAVVEAERLRTSRPVLENRTIRRLRIMEDPAAAAESDWYLRRPLSLISTFDSVLEYLDELLLQNRKSSSSTIQTDVSSIDDDLASLESDSCENLQRVMDLSFASVYELDNKPVVFDVFNVTDIRDSEATDSGLDATSMSDCEQVISEEVTIPDCAKLPQKEKRSKRKQKEKIYEICLGYECVKLETDSLSIVIYSLQKSKDTVGSNGSVASLQSSVAESTFWDSKDFHTMGRIFHSLILTTSTSLIRDRKLQSHVYSKTMIASEMIDWLVKLSPEVRSRAQAAAMWQVLLQEAAIVPAGHDEYQFRDKFLFYRFKNDIDVDDLTEEQVSEAKLRKHEIVEHLSAAAPDAICKAVLRKRVSERTTEDVDVIYEELSHIRGLSHLSMNLKRELAQVIVFESAPNPGTILFGDGDEGLSWYVVLKGSVNVVIHGKGPVCSLRGADGFRQPALIRNTPRNATVVRRDEDCHFLRVDKEDFNKILGDVEANTVRLKEHGRDVLVLEKVAPSSNTCPQHKYTVMAGTPQKMLEHLLETRLDTLKFRAVEEETWTSKTDVFLDDFLLTHIMFLPTQQLVDLLLGQYRTESHFHDREFIALKKRRVINFACCWLTTIREAAYEDPTIHSFIQALQSEVNKDVTFYSKLRESTVVFDRLCETLARYRCSRQKGSLLGPRVWNLPSGGQSVSLFLRKDGENRGDEDHQCSIRADDDIIFRVYRQDHTFCTLRLPFGATAETVKYHAADKLGLARDNLVLAEIKSNGERHIFKDHDLSIPTSLSVNGRIFVGPKEHVDAMNALTEQEGPSIGSMNDLEKFSTRELAYEMSLSDWNSFCAIHEYELLYHVTGSSQFRKTKSNLDVFLRRFNELQYWVVTEVCLTNGVAKRAQLLKKFIKLAAYFKEHQNLNAFFAIVMGLNNVAVSRLSQTWERLPAKLRKLLADFDGLTEPSRNHRAYRIAVSKLEPPIIPFMPLLLKDLTFSHEGNRTLLDTSGLVNFEKMHMMAQTLRNLRYCRSRPMLLEPPVSQDRNQVRSYLRNLRVIDDQRILNVLSNRLEPKRS